MAADTVLPLDPPPRPWRLSSRLVLLDSADQVLLIRACDPDDPSFGDWWEVPGGGVEAGEDTVTAALRETAEETGYVVAPEVVGPPLWRGEATFTWAGHRYWSSLVMHLGRVRVHPPSRPVPAPTVPEPSSVLEVCWLPYHRVVGGGERFFPATLAADLPRLLVGESVDAGFSVWS